MGQTLLYQTSFFKHQTCLSIGMVIELEHPTFGFERTNIDPKRTFTRITNLLIDMTQTSFFQT